MAGHEQLRLSLGAYALGTLEPADERAVEAHLASCPACLAELDELAAVLPSLELVSADDLARPEPSAGLFDRIAGAVDTSAVDTSADTSADDSAEDSVPARPARRRWLLAVAASVLVLAGAGTAVGFALSGSSHQTTISGSANGVHLAVDASDTTNGTRLVLTVAGLPAHEHCHLVAVDAAGRPHDAGWWEASYDGEARVVETTAVPRSQLRGLTLYGTRGEQLVHVDV